MGTVRANGIELEYETFGSSSDPALLLVMGLGAQLTSWDERFCRRLADAGFRVIRYDNRDVGLSTKIDGGGAPADLAATLAEAAQGGRIEAPYLIEDMADDAAGLLDGLDIDAAHVVGASMGGMIAQAIAIRHPERVLSLCSIMSTTGDRSVGQPSPEAGQALLSARPRTAEEAGELSLQVSRVIGSKGFPLDEERIRRRAEDAFRRSSYPDGFARQVLAIMASPDRTPDLAKVEAPTLVIHGDVDPLVTPSGGEATARAVPGAELLMVPGMGHDLPEGAWPMIIEAIVANARRRRR
ncbi:MAG TPA: alpha/beta fold hydrolase [Acidimicrobiales bacterium]|nr:alpha/beta fold hydrolase [Acidimicrobiales bacterium]